MTAPQLRLMSMMVTVAKLKSTVSARATTTAMAPQTTTTMTITTLAMTTMMMTMGGGAGQKRKRGTIVEEWEEMEVGEEEGEEAVCVTFLRWKSKLGMNKVALFEYYNT